MGGRNPRRITALLRAARVAALVTVAALAGCATARDYPGAPGGPTAHLTIVNTIGQRLDVSLYEDAAACTNRFRIGHVAEHDRSIAIPANRDFAFTYWWEPASGDYPQLGGHYCRGTHSFEPADGHSYRADFKFGLNSCEVVVVDESAGDAPVKLAVRRFTKAASETGSWCAPL